LRGATGAIETLRECLGVTALGHQRLWRQFDRHVCSASDKLTTLVHRASRQRWANCRPRLTCEQRKLAKDLLLGAGAYLGEFPN
jgi:hypothetical protein